MSLTAGAPNCPLFDGVEPAVVQGLLARAHRAWHRPGDDVVCPHEPQLGVLAVFSGIAKVFVTSSDGQQVLLRLVAAGEVVVCAPGSLPVERVQALSEVQALLLSRGDFHAALERSPRLTANALRCVSLELAEAHRRIRSLASEGVEERLAQLLHSFMQQYGRPLGDGICIDLPLTQDELADMLGAARRSVTRSFQRWTRCGALRKRDGRFIVDARRLQARRVFAPRPSAG